MQEARVRLAGTRPEDLDDICEDVGEIAESTGVSLSGPIPLPTKTLEVPARKSPDGEGTATWEHWEMRVQTADRYRRRRTRTPPAHADPGAKRREYRDRPRRLTRVLYRSLAVARLDIPSSIFHLRSVVFHAIFTCVTHYPVWLCAFGRYGDGPGGGNPYQIPASQQVSSVF